MFKIALVGRDGLDKFRLFNFLVGLIKKNQKH